MARTLIGDPEGPHDYLQAPSGDFLAPAQYLLALLVENGAPDPALKLLSKATLRDISAFPSAWDVVKEQEPQAVTVIAGHTHAYGTVAVTHSARIYRLETAEVRDLNVQDLFSVSGITLHPPHAYSIDHSLAKIKPSDATLHLPLVAEMATWEGSEPFIPFAQQLDAARLNGGSNGTVLGTTIAQYPRVAVSMLREIFG